MCRAGRRGPTLRGWQGPWSRSCHSATAVDAALTEGAGWVTLSPVHRPRSKPDDRRPPLGLDGFLSIASDRPVGALGGMDVERVAALAQAGGAGAAVCGALFGRANPAEAARACEALLQALDRAA